MSDESEENMERARELIREFRVYRSFLEEQNEFLTKQNAELAKHVAQLERANSHDHCCNECMYHSDPHRRCF